MTNPYQSPHDEKPDGAEGPIHGGKQTCKVFCALYFLYGLLPLRFAIVFVPMDPVSWFAAATVAFVVLWWGSGLSLLAGWQWAWLGCALAATVPAGLALYMSWKPIRFILTHDGMERADGVGSPAAFLGWIWPVLILGPAGFTFLLWASIKFFQFCRAKGAIS